MPQKALLKTVGAVHLTTGENVGAVAATTTVDRGTVSVAITFLAVKYAGMKDTLLTVATIAMIVPSPLLNWPKLSPAHAPSLAVFTMTGTLTQVLWHT